MIVATRISQLTQQMLEATRKAAERQRTASAVPAPADSPEHRLVQFLEELGYNVRIERRVA